MLKLIKEHKGIIIFWLAIVIFALWFSNQIERTNEEVTNSQNNQVEEWSE